MTVRNISGPAKAFLHLRVKVHVFLHTSPALFTGRIPARHYGALLRRLLFFLSKLRHNKYVKIGRYTRFNLYVPGYPSKAFFTACAKFATFGDRLPCITVLVSITSACRFRCEHCYQKNDIGKDLDIEKLVPVVKRLQDLGVAFFNIEGGDPFLVYDRLKRVCEAIDDRSEIWVNSTGDGMTAQRLTELKRLGLTAVMFSMHTPYPANLCRFMGSEKAWDTMTKGIELCHAAGVPVAFNICLKRESFYNGEFEKLMESARDFGAAIIQLIKPKPAGGWLASAPEAFSEDDLQKVRELVTDYNHKRAYAHYPSISAQIMEEDKGMFGCTAGGTDRFYINAKGDVQPCEFLNISFGNIGSEDFDAIYARMRERFVRPCSSWVCEKYAAAIRGVMKSNGVDRLPLDPTLSEQVYSGWDRGTETELYARVEAMR